MAIMSLFGRLSGLILGALASSCTGAPPPVPPLDGPLRLAIRYPESGSPAPRKMVGVWGSVGSGRAALTVNGRSTRIEPNGAFVDWVPMEPTSTPTLLFTASLDGRTVTRRVSLTPVPEERFVHPRETRGWVRLRRSASETVDAATQRAPVAARWYPGGPFALYLPLGARMPMEARTDGAIGVRLSDGLRVWIPAEEADTLVPPPPDLVTLGPMSLLDAKGIAELSLPLAEPLPSVVELDGTRMRWSIFGAQHATPAAGPVGRSSLVSQVRRRNVAPGLAIVELRLTTNPSGWRARWDAGRLTLQVRRPRSHRRLAGLVIALDPGHPPGGTTGPTGLREDSVTLAVARAAARRLERLGARPVLTRNDTSSVTLATRLAIAEAADVDALVSIHVDAPAMDEAPWMVDGARAFYRQPTHRRFAALLHDSVAAAMRQPRRGIARSNLTMLRSAWFPSVLIEGTCLTLPRREASLRTPAGIEAYADGIVGGLEAWASGAAAPRHVPE